MIYELVPVSAFICQIRSENTDLENNDECETCCQDVPELQRVRVGLSRIWRLPVVPVPAVTQNNSLKYYEGLFV